MTTTNNAVLANTSRLNSRASTSTIVHWSSVLSGEIFDATTEANLYVSAGDEVPGHLSDLIGALLAEDARLESLLAPRI